MCRVCCRASSLSTMADHYRYVRQSVNLHFDSAGTIGSVDIPSNCFSSRNKLKGNFITSSPPSAVLRFRSIIFYQQEDSSCPLLQYQILQSQGVARPELRVQVPLK
ncbi:hypothetical protein NPIL_527491 [Nephila pilipes]|uniref:Uncharacterized protein n=1 Tax=Nephila pilipes TaxID=299642 RepID=A0A8X6IMI1_NEPPI|nr:hypothetical protein NPIL_527491 [Nephila pilipes]